MPAILQIMQIKQILKEVKNEVSKIYGDRLSHMILYGSWARGEATEGSDIDLLIALKGRVNNLKEISRMKYVIYDIQFENGIEISTITVSENQYKKNNMPVYLNIRNEGIEVSEYLNRYTPKKLREIYEKRKNENNRKLFHKNFRPMKFNKEIKQLIEKSKGELEEAEGLFDIEKYEGSVSRCYYSLFHSAQAALLTKNIDPFHFQHKTIVSKFGELFIKTEIFPKDMSNYLTETKDRREDADYDSAVGFISKEEAATKIENGKKFNQTIENYIQKLCQKK